MRAISFSLLLASSLGIFACSPTPRVNITKPIHPIDLSNLEVVDLTHTFDTTIPHWHGLPKMKEKALYNHAKDGFMINQYQIAGQWGTHVDSPFHFHKDGVTLDKIAAEDMVLPLVILDVQDRAVANPDYQLEIKDIEAWEQKNGRIPERAFIAMRTGWSKRWPDESKIRNMDKNKIAHYPGWSKDTLQFLIKERNAAAFAHETPDTDPGVATSKDDYSLESYILAENRYQIEFIANLEKLPEVGAVAVATWPKVRNGSGFPARVVALVPKVKNT